MPVPVLTEEQYARIGRILYAIIFDKTISGTIRNDHTVFRQLSTLWAYMIAYEIPVEEGCLLSARRLFDLTYIASARTIPAGKRMEKMGFVWTTSVEGKSSDRKVYHLNEEPFHLSPIHRPVASSNTFPLEIDGKHLLIRIIMEEDIKQ
jgi:hypothetical protein